MKTKRNPKIKRTAMTPVERQRKSRAERTKQLGMHPLRHRNLATKRHATQNGQRWSLVDDVAVLSGERPLCKLAKSLGRTLFSVEQRSKFLRKEISGDC
jgi:hypothetical protein